MTTALAQLEPTNMTELMTFANWLSKSALIPRALQGKPADVAIVLMRGRDLGLSSMQSLASIDVIEGKAVESAELIVAMCLRHPAVCEYFNLTESTAEKATYKAKRRNSPEPSTITWTIQMATRAGLAGKDNWKRHTEAMLRHRAASALARVVFPDLTLGIVTPDEAEEIAAPPQHIPSLEQKAASRTEELKKMLPQPSVFQVVDVKPGETEEAAVARSAEEQMALGMTP